MALKTEKGWTFVPVHKSRIIKELERSYLLNTGSDVLDSQSVILPKVFKRTKESKTHIFFSLPNDIKLSVRHNYYNDEKKCYMNEDKDIKMNYLEVLDSKLD